MRIPHPPTGLRVYGVLIGFMAVWITAGCFVFRSVGVESVPLDSPITVESSVKAHLADGSTVLYPDGLTIDGDSVRGSGTRWDLALTDTMPAWVLPLDSVLAMEAFDTNVDPGATIGVSLLATAGVMALSVAIYCAVDPKCFGSCPTFYSDSAGSSILEAEGFSYAIAPLLEARDVDRLRARPDRDGKVRVEVRNEALETHYLNHVSLLDVRHESDELALPDRHRQPLAVRNLRPLRSVVDRNGRNVTEELAEHDGRYFQTAPARLAAVTGNDFDDHLIFRIPVSPTADSVALVFRLRNSLLTTVLFYDVMLGDQGARALDWLAIDLADPFYIIELGRRASKNLGLRVLVPDDNGWRVVGRFANAGPIAWKDVALLVPVTESLEQRVRIEFVADNWRIDRLAYTTEWRRPEWVGVELEAAIAPGGESVPVVVQQLASADGKYLRTSMGHRFTAVFGPERVSRDLSRTFFLVSQGYYTEWIRRAWLKNGRERSPFRPDKATILDALTRWRLSQDSMERAFYATRVPMR